MGWILTETGFLTPSDRLMKLHQGFIFKNMRLIIKKAQLVPDQYGKHIKITMVQLLNDDGSHNKFIPLNGETLAIILSHSIEIPKDFDLKSWNVK